LLLAFFPDLDYYFLQGLYQQEIFASPRGVSLVRLLPATYVKFMPLLLICFGLLYVRRYRTDLQEYLPFFIGAGILMLTYPTKAYEYNVSTIFCFIPFVAYWADLPGSWRGTVIRRLAKYVLFVFLLTASYSRVLVRIFDTHYIIFFIYLMVAAIFLIGPLILPSHILLNEHQPRLNDASNNINS